MTNITTGAVRKTTATRKTTVTSKARTTPSKAEKTKVEISTTPEVVETVHNPGSQYVLPNDPVQQQALVDSYWALKQGGVPIPDAIRIPVEDWIQKVQSQAVEEHNSAAQHEEDALNARVAHLNVHGPTYVRNLTNMSFHIRLDSQHGNSAGGRPRRIELKPRGMRGDMHPIKDEDLQDSVLITNLNLGLIELIPAGEAQLVIEKQVHNMSQRIHTPTQIIAN